MGPKSPKSLNKSQVLVFIYFDHNGDCDLGSHTHALPRSTFPAWNPESRNRSQVFKSGIQSPGPIHPVHMDRLSDYSALQREAYVCESEACPGGAGAGTCGPWSMQGSIIGVKKTPLGMKRTVCQVPPSHPKGPHLFSGSQEERRYLPGVERCTHPCLAAGRHRAYCGCSALPQPHPQGRLVVKALYYQRSTDGGCRHLPCLWKHNKIASRLPPWA